ncbi:MAG TPA: GNAT family protein [Phycicoccus sp.]|jgi:RimJ/RimL family protein N-acetyltransferase|nr:GNAT family protein [Phycicoccus sp.]HQH07947.1 GNAT family protein [Phycicoccus sp.]HQK31037.1 GNAT family protein [Phycicoccus sp.]HQV90232.1 GNAT family protein [Phycicoccus sp.]HQY97168.1 GNAT family protein [Phycicoccus sp.]
MLDWSHKPTLMGERVLLRPFAAGDADAMAQVLDDPEVLRLTGSVTTSQQAAQGFTRDAAFDEWYATRHDASERLDLAVIDRATDRLVGEIVLNERQRDEEGALTCNLRILLGTEGRDRGLGTEAVALLTAYGLDVLALQRITLEVFAFNPRARHVYEKVGFVHEATEIDALIFDGQGIDAHVMAITRSPTGARGPAGGED